MPLRLLSRLEQVSLKPDEQIPDSRHVAEFHRRIVDAVVFEF